MIIIGAIQWIITQNTNNDQLLPYFFEWPEKLSIKSKQCMPTTHPEISHSDRDVELIIFNRAIILIIKSGISIVHIWFSVVFFIFIIIVLVAVGIDTRVYIGVFDFHKGVVVFTHYLVIYTPYYINIYCFSRIFILRADIYSCSTYFHWILIPISACLVLYYFCTRKRFSMLLLNF